MEEGLSSRREALTAECLCVGAGGPALPAAGQGGGGAKETAPGAGVDRGEMSSDTQQVEVRREKRTKTHK